MVDHVLYVKLSRVLSSGQSKLEHHMAHCSIHWLAPGTVTAQHTHMHTCGRLEESLSQSGTADGLCYALKPSPVLAAVMGVALSVYTSTCVTAWCHVNSSTPQSCTSSMVQVVVWCCLHWVSCRRATSPPSRQAPSLLPPSLALLSHTT